MDLGRADERVRVPGARCPFCHEEVPRGEEPAVCVGCHALHHVACLLEHGGCAACGAAHPRSPSRAAPAEGRATRDEGPWGPGRRTATLLTTLLFVTSVLPIASSLLATPEADTAGFAPVLIAPLLGAAGTIMRGALFGLTCWSMVLGSGLVVLLALGRHVSAPERAETVLAAAALLTVGLVLGAAQLRARRTAIAAKEKEKA